MRVQLCSQQLIINDKGFDDDDGENEGVSSIKCINVQTKTRYINKRKKKKCAIFSF